MLLKMALPDRKPTCIVASTAPVMINWAAVIGLFFVQRFGTGRVTPVIGLITALWFFAIGFSSLVHVVQVSGVVAIFSQF